MKILVIEDEKLAADRLMKMIREIEPTAEFLATIVSIQSAVEWFRHHPDPDLILMDIHLADGQSFDVFKSVRVNAPVIFVTAYDEHALEAFTVNSIDYLLKPVKKEDLQRAFDKFHRFSGSNSVQIEQLLQQLGVRGKEFQKRMVIRYGDTIKMVDIHDVAYFYTEDKINYLCTHANLKYPIDFNLDELEGLLDPASFFRINRQFIINISAIDKMLAWSKSRVKVVLKPATQEDTIVSTERSPFFKDWLTGTGK